MKKTLLATAIPALLFANVASATELYADEVNTFTVGGHFSAGLTGSDEGETGVNSVSPRINFGATRDLGNGFTADALVEWSINTTGGEQALSTRLAYAGLGHESYGYTAIGTQWAPSFDVTGAADLPIAFANDFLYNADMGAMGTARADDMVSYRNSFDVADNMALNFGLGWQGAKQVDIKVGDVAVAHDYDARVQGMVSFDFANFNVGAAYNTGDVTVASRKETATSAHISAKYGTYGQGLYVGAVYGQNEFAYRAGENYDQSTDAEAIIAYAFANSINVSLNYEAVSDDVKKQTLYSTSALQLEYNFTQSVVGYVGYQVDLGSDLAGHKDDNVWMIGGRIYL